MHTALFRDEGARSRHSRSYQLLPPRGGGQPTGNLHRPKAAAADHGIEPAPGRSPVDIDRGWEASWMRHAPVRFVVLHALVAARAPPVASRSARRGTPSRSQSQSRDRRRSPGQAAQPVDRPPRPFLPGGISYRRYSHALGCRPPRGQLAPGLRVTAPRRLGRSCDRQAAGSLELFANHWWAGHGWRCSASPRTGCPDAGVDGAQRGKFR